MNSLTALAHATAPAAPALNRDLYITAATVIPVLFLAINAQPVFQYFGLTTPASRSQASQGQLTAVGVATIIVYFFMVVGIAGEIVAILALNHQTASPAVQDLVLVTTIMLTVAAGLGPILGAFSARARLEALAHLRR